MVTIALKTLSSFDFTEYVTCIVTFIEKSVLNYLDDENPQIRKLAMQTCCTLHLPSTTGLQISQTIKKMINKANSDTDQLNILLKYIEYFSKPEQILS